MILIKRSEALLNKKMKKLIKKKRNAQIKTIIGDVTSSALTDCRGSTLLHLAVLYKSIELVEYTIDAGCNVNAQDIFKNTPLMIATTQLNFKLIKRLIDADADIFSTNQADECPLYMILKDLVNVPLDVFACFLKEMENSGRVEDIAEIFVRSKCKLNVIVSMKNAEWTKAVLKRLVKIDKTESLDSIEQALDLMHVPNIEVLLHYGDDVSSRRDYFFEKLIHFTENRNLQLVETLIENLVNWDVWDSELRAVIIMGRLFETADEAVIKIFMQTNLHLQIKNRFDIDLMAHCGGNPDPGVAKLLRQYFIDNDKKPPVGIEKLSVLHFAVENGVMENVDTCLIKIGMNANLQDAAGRTPIFYACCSARNVELDDRKEIVFKLLFYGAADPLILDNYDLTGLDLYDPENDWPVIQIVMQYFARLLVIDYPHEFVDMRMGINVRAEISEYFKKCFEQLQDMKKYRFCGMATVYSLITQPLTVTARKARNNNAIELYDKENVSKWEYFYRRAICTSIDLIKNINDEKDSIASILHECLGKFRLDGFIITEIVDRFTYNDLRNFKQQE